MSFYNGNAICDTMDGEEYSETGRPLFVGERKAPKNAPPMRSAREAMNDPRNRARTSSRNGVRR